MTDVGERLAELRERFVLRTVAQARTMERCLARLEAGEEIACQVHTIRQLAHSVAGMAGMFGFVALGRAAGCVERALMANCIDPDHVLAICSPFVTMMKRPEQS